MGGGASLAAGRRLDAAAAASAACNWRRARIQSAGQGSAHSPRRGQVGRLTARRAPAACNATLSYARVHRQVCGFGNVCKAVGAGEVDAAGCHGPEAGGRLHRIAGRPIGLKDARTMGCLAVSHARLSHTCIHSVAVGAGRPSSPR